ncbi:hypothetical protein L6452_07101 [Arctium lappa]|uniref:Uncharacterized protein n=1 Tax=Arctium lappa TaxID=4217 RepID=A0ACB9EL35_ARCLA|nr:hypothetical protein L6452_07101 [Arctium lappa]
MPRHQKPLSVARPLEKTRMKMAETGPTMLRFTAAYEERQQLTLFPLSLSLRSEKTKTQKQKSNQIFFDALRMDADERLTALKKAYADIILNTAKEAAARIMVSERKALRFEYELKNAKEDALQMLLRLKKMMDSKINEAAVASCTQQKKIEELEAQLQEAEDIVKDLREELRAVETELERFSQSKEVKHPVQVDYASTGNVPRTSESIPFPPSEVQPDSNTDQTTKSQRLYNSLFPIKKSLISSGDLPSIILRSKETELYRNGCTQRIRACERTPPDKNLSFSVQMDGIKPESIVKEDEAPDKLRKSPSPGVDILCSVEEKEVILDQVKEMDLAAEDSCLTSPSSVKHSNDTAMQENSDEGRTVDGDLVRTCNSQSRIREELMPTRLEKDESLHSVEPQVDPPLKISETKVSETSEVPSQPMTDRVIKYTFQRKRKRGALIDGCASSERSEENQKAQNLGPGKANLIGESTPEKIRLEQVARQYLLGDKLLSLGIWSKANKDLRWLMLRKANEGPRLSQLSMYTEASCDVTSALGT